jgi:hypothetical protein
MAAHIGCCIDTLKRILVKMGLEDFPGAKYQVALRLKPTQWNRPCMDCGDQKPRPRAWYYCPACRSRRGFE